MSPKKDMVKLLLANTLSTHIEIQRKATEELEQEFGDGESTLALCELLGLQHPAELRLCAAEILSKRLASCDQWSGLSADMQGRVQTMLFLALQSLNRYDDLVLQQMIVQSVSVLMDHERSNTTEGNEGRWADAVFQYVEAICLSTETELQKLGATVLGLMADVAPGVFTHQMERTLRIFVNGLRLADERNLLGTPISECLCKAWNRSLPHGHSHLNDRSALSASLPLVMKTLKLLAPQHPPERVNCVFDLLHNLLEFTPEVVENQLPVVLEQLIAITIDINLSRVLRVRSIELLGCLILNWRRHIIRMGWMNKILLALHSLFVERVLDWDSDADTPDVLAAGIHVLLKILQQSCTARMATRALQLIEPKKNEQQTETERSGTQYFLAVMAEGFVHQIDRPTMDRFMSVVQRGKMDTSAIVRQASHYAIAKMVQHLQPEITLQADAVFPIFYNFLDTAKVSGNLRLSSKRASMKNSNMFYALETFIESLRLNAIILHIPEIMYRLLAYVQPEQNSLWMQHLALRCIATLARKSKDYFEPYFDTVCDIALGFNCGKAVDGHNELEILLRSQSFQIIATLAQVSKEKFSALCPRLMDLTMKLLHNKDRADIIIFTYPLLCELAVVAPEQFKENFPMIMGHLIQTIDRLNADGSTHSTISTYVDSGDTDERVEALRCIRSFAVHLPDFLYPYRSKALRCALKCVAQKKELMQRAAFEALSKLLQLQWKHWKPWRAQQLCLKVFPHLMAFMETTSDAGNACAVLACVQPLLKDPKIQCRVIKDPKTQCRALKDPKIQCRALKSYASQLLMLMEKILLRRLRCQAVNDDTTQPTQQIETCSEIVYQERQLMELVGDVLPILGQTVGQKQFGVYIRRLVMHCEGSCLRQFEDGNISGHQSLIVYVLCHCIEQLANRGRPYYNLLCSGIIKGLLDEKWLVRERSLFSLNVLILCTEDRVKHIIKAVSETLIKTLQPDTILSVAEQEQVCGLICFMIIIDHQHCPIEQFVDAIIRHLPFTEVPTEYIVVTDCLMVVFEHYYDYARRHMTDILLLMSSQLEDRQTTDQCCAKWYKLLRLISKKQQEYPSNDTKYSEDLIDILSDDDDLLFELFSEEKLQHDRLSDNKE